MSVTNDTRAQPNDSVLYVCATFALIFDIISITGHGLLLVAISKRRVLQTNANGYIISLAIAELLFAVVCLPALLANYWAQKNTMSNVICKTQNFLSSITNGVAMWHIGFMAMNHYVLMAYHEHYIKYTTRQATFTQLIFTWALPVLVVVAGMTGNVEENIYQTHLLRCVFKSTSTLSTILFSTILDAILPGAIAISAFVLSGILIRKRRNLVWSELSLVHITRISKEDIRIVKIYIVVFVRIVIAYIPPMFNRTAADLDVSSNLCVLVDTVAWCLMCSNPIIYATMHHKFRQTFKMMLMKDLTADWDDEDDDYPDGDQKMDMGGASPVDGYGGSHRLSTCSSIGGHRLSTCSSVGLASSWARRASIVY